MTEWRYSSIEYRAVGSASKPSSFIYLLGSIADPIGFLRERLEMEIEEYIDPVDQMKTRGIILTSPRHSAAAYSGQFSNVSAAQRAVQSIEPSELGGCPVKYQLVGRGQTEQIAWVTEKKGLEGTIKWLEHNIGKPIKFAREDWPLTAGEYLDGSEYTIEQIIEFFDILGDNPEVGEAYRNLQITLAPLVAKLKSVQQKIPIIQMPSLKGINAGFNQTEYLGHVARSTRSFCNFGGIRSRTCRG